MISRNNNRAAKPSATLRALALLALSGGLLTVAGCDNAAEPKAATTPVSTATPEATTTAAPAATARPATANGAPTTLKAGDVDPKALAEFNLGTDTPPNAGEARNIADARVDLEWNTDVYDFGTLYDESAVSGEYIFTNRADVPVTIQLVKPACGCTATNNEDVVGKTFEPGESATLGFAFKPKGAGTQTKGITVTAADPQGRQMQYRLSLTANLVPAVRTITRVAQFGSVRTGESGTALVSLESGDENFRPIAIEDRDGNPIESITWEFERLENGTTPDMPARGQLILKTDPLAPLGGFSEPITIVVAATAGDGSTGEHRYPLTMTGTIVGDIVGEPQFLRIPMSVPNDAFEASTTVRHNGIDPVPFNITKVEVLNAEFDEVSAEAIPVEGSENTAYTIILKGVTPENQRLISGEILITTDLPNHGPMKLRFTGPIRVAPAPVRRGTS